MAGRRAQHLRCSLRCYVREANEWTTGWIRCLTYVLRTQRALQLNKPPLVAALVEGLWLQHWLNAWGPQALLLRREEPRSPASNCIAILILSAFPATLSNSKGFLLPNVVWLAGLCRFTTYRHRFARAAPAPRAKRNERIVDVHRPSSRAARLLSTFPSEAKKPEVPRQIVWPATARRQPRAAPQGATVLL